MFNHNFWTTVLIFKFIFSLKRLCFTVVPLLIWLPFDILKFLCLSVWILLGHYSSKNLFNVKNFGYVFHVCNLSSYIKNCDPMLDTFYRAAPKSFLNLCLAVSFEGVLWFLLFCCCCWKAPLLMIILLLIVLPLDRLKFACLPVGLFEHLFGIKIK